MGLWNGTLSLRRYHLLTDKCGKTFRDNEGIEKALRAHALVPLDPEGTEEKSLGWASPLDEQDLDLTTAKVWIDGFLVLTLRMDTLKAPPAEVKRLLKLRQRELEAQRKEPLSASALRELKQMIALDLRRRTPVKTRTAWVVVDLENRRVYLTSHSKGTNEAFLTLFAQTFNEPVDLAGPALWTRQTLSNEQVRALRPAAVLASGFADLRPCPNEANTIQRGTDGEENPDLLDVRYLAREFLTWLIYRCSQEGGAHYDASAYSEAFQCMVGEHIRVRSLGEGANDVRMRGVAPSETPDARYMIAGGHSVREVELHFTQGERLYTAMVLAEGFDLARVRLPSLLSDEDTERETERLRLIDELNGMLRAAFVEFLRVRGSDEWDRGALPALHEWLRESLANDAN